MNVDTRTDRHFLFLLASARTGGNTETLTEHAAKGLGADVRQTWLRLDEHPLPTFADRRHGGESAPERGANERSLLSATLAATDIVIASPLYWYSVSASAKLYLDHWSGWMDDPALEFRKHMRGKKLWGVSALSDNSSTQAEPLAGTLHRSADFLGMRWGGVLLGNGSRPGNVLRDGEALGRAATFFHDEPARLEPLAG